MTESRPPFLRPGDRLRVISPSGAIKDYDRFNRGLQLWEDWGFTLDFGAHYRAKLAYLGGTDEQRREDLNNAWADPDCKGIICTRGGYGTTRLLEQWQWPDSKLKWLIGFSDITALLWSLASQNIMGLHGPVMTTIAGEPAWSQERLKNFLLGQPLAPLQGEGWGLGKVQGRLFPGNMTVIDSLLGTPWEPDLTGAILALEDISEAPYRLDRIITAWRSRGLMAKIAGVALGDFTDCAGTNGWEVEDMFRDRLGDLNLPVVSKLPFGHGSVNACLPVGAMAELDSDRGLLTFL
jgi:muramoyltetrapeptide carboxypeptidase